MKLNYTISRVSQERSLSELKQILHHLCELGGTQISAVLKKNHAGYFLSGKRSNLIKKEIFSGITPVYKNVTIIRF